MNRIQPSRSNKAKLKKKLNKCCPYCGCTNKLLLTIDHTVPLCRGGTDTTENKQVCCNICNQLKGGLNDAEFRRYYKALQVLYDLAKISLRFDRIQVNFFPDRYPDFKTPQEKCNDMIIEAKQNGNLKDNNNLYKRDIWDRKGGMV